MPTTLNNGKFHYIHLALNNQMPREPYFRKIGMVRSPLTLLPDKLEIFLADDRVHDPHHITPAMQFADMLDSVDAIPAKTRAEFIRLQCLHEPSDIFFEAHCESWGIPRFEEKLLTANDFKNGFMLTFRDHSTSWKEEQEARNWFYNHTEALFARQYEFWSRDKGPQELIFQESGNYKELLWTLVNKYQDYSALVSHVFSKKELEDFYINFDEETADFYMHELLEYMEQNPNW